MGNISAIIQGAGYNPDHEERSQQGELELDQQNQGAIPKRPCRSSYRHTPTTNPNRTAGTHPVLSKKRNQDDAGKLKAALKLVLGCQVPQQTLPILNNNGPFIEILLKEIQESSLEFFSKRELIVQNGFCSSDYWPTYHLWVYFKASHLTAACDPALPWVQVSVTTTNVPGPIIMKWCDGQNRVTPKKVLSWLTKVIDKSRPTLDSSKSNLDLKSIQRRTNEYCVILDLEFIKPQGQKARLCVIPCLDIKTLSGIPQKLSHGVLPGSYYSLVEKNQWIVADKKADSFLTGSVALQLYKLLQRLVNIKNWNECIHTYILQNIMCHPDVLKQCTEDNLGNAFIQALKCLVEAIKTNCLPHPQLNWDIMKNLFTKNADTKKMLVAELSKIIEYSQINPCWIESLLKGNNPPSPYPPMNKLNAIMDTIKIDDQSREENISVITRLVEEVVLNAKENTVFGSLFNKIEYTGSYYENLRVWTPDEFDIDFVFKFPLDQFEIENLADPRLPVYKKLRVKDFMENYSKKAKFSGAMAEFKSFLSKEGYLQRTKFIDWFKSVLDKVRPNLTLENLKIRKIRRKTSGPAITWIVTLLNGEEIDVDLVPVFIISHTKPFPEGVCKSLTPFLKGEAWNWVLVPKPLKQTNSEYIWRVHLLYAEKNLLDRPKQCFKPTIRLVKLLRDTQSWSNVSSYFIKILAFHLWYETQDNSNYWNNANMPVCIFHMLHKLKNCLKDGELPSFFFPEYNLLSQLPSKSIAQNISTELDRILPELAMEPQPYFLPTDSRDRFELQSFRTL